MIVGRDVARRKSWRDTPRCGDCGRWIVLPRCYNLLCDARHPNKLADLGDAGVDHGIGEVWLHGKKAPSWMQFPPGVFSE